MAAFLVVLIIFLIGCGCSSAKEEARVAKLKRNNTNLPLQGQIERKIFNQMIPEYKEELWKLEKRRELYDWEEYSNKKILDILAVRYNIPTSKEIREMNGYTCHNLSDLASLYAQYQVVKMGYDGVVVRGFGAKCRRDPYPEDAEYHDIEYKNPYETAMEECKRRDDIDKKYPGLFTSTYKGKTSQNTKK